jgi:hypothetical protein
MSFWKVVQNHFRDPRPQTIRDNDRQRQQREDQQHRRREDWQEGATRDPYAPPVERAHPNDPDRRHGGGGW